MSTPFLTPVVERRGRVGKKTPSIMVPGSKVDLATVGGSDELLKETYPFSTFNVTEFKVSRQRKLDPQRKLGLRTSSENRNRKLPLP